MISLKTYKQGEDLLIGACDEKLLGKKLEDGKFNLNISKEFYEGQKITTKQLQKFLEKATIANLVGKETVEYAIKKGFVDADCIIKIKGIPHAQIVRMI